MAGSEYLRHQKTRYAAAGLVSLTILIAAGAGQTQTPAQPPPQPPPQAAPASGNAQPQAPDGKNSPEMATSDVAPTFTTRSNLVLLRVVVRDRDGHSNGALQKEDFQLFDKGKPQSISRFSLEKTTERKAEAVSNANAAGNSTAGPMAPERYVAYVFDDAHLSFGDLAQARNAAEKHLSEMPASSRAAIFTTSGLVTQDFTDDVPKLRDALRRIQPRTTISSR